MSSLNSPDSLKTTKSWLLSGRHRVSEDVTTLRAEAGLQNKAAEDEERCINVSSQQPCEAFTKSFDWRHAGTKWEILSAKTTWKQIKTERLLHKP